MSGRGVEAIGRTGRGSPSAGPSLLRERSLDVPDELAAQTEPWRGRGASVLYLVRDDAVAGRSRSRTESAPKRARRSTRLHELGISVAMITGDARQVADAVAAELGIDEVFAEVLPEDKERHVRELQERGRRSRWSATASTTRPALARADVGIAIGAGTDVAIESAGVILASTIRAASSASSSSRARATARCSRTSAWAVGYNVLAIPLAAGVLAPCGHHPARPPSARS